MAKKRKMHGHYCKICGERKANEKFSGKGHAAHICKACAKLPAAERSEMQALGRIEGMAMRHINDSEIKWLQNRMKDSREDVREAAIAVNQLKFPNNGKPARKTAIRTMTLYICDTVWDDWGDEVDVHATVEVSNSGLLRHVDHNLPQGENMAEVAVPVKVVKQLFREAIRIRDYAEDMTDDERSFDIDYGDMDEWLIRDIIEIEESLQDAGTDEIKASLELSFKDGDIKKYEFNDQIPDEISMLYWSIDSWFEPDDEYDLDDDENVDYE